jgi:hypothetical protein
MITRIHGASSTLAANPPRKHRRAKRKNPMHAKKRRNAEAAAPAKKARAKVGRTIAERLAAYQKRVEQLTERAAKAAEKASRKGTGRARGPRTEKGIAKAARKAQRAELGYALKALPAGGQLVSYVYPRKGAADKRGRRKTVGYMSGTKLVKGIKPKFSIYKAADGKINLHRNPAIGNLVIAGVPVVNMAIGSVAAIGIGMIAEKLVKKYAPTVASSPVGDITGELATAGIAAYLHGSKFLKNPMHKSIAQFAFIGAVFQILSKKATSYIGPLVDKIPGLSGHEGYTGGVYFDPYTESPAVGGAYLSTESMGGMYTSVDSGSAVGGLGLFNAPSIYG